MRLNAADLAVAAAAVVITVVMVLRPALGAALGAGALPLEFLLLHLRRRWTPNLVALLLLLAVSVLVALTLAFSLVSLALQHWIYLATIVPSYAHLVLFAPPALPARAAADAQFYWAALERQRAGGALLTPAGFCTRSGAARPPRTKYSPLSQCLVPVRDSRLIPSPLATNPPHRLLFLVQVREPLLIHPLASNYPPCRPCFISKYETHACHNSSFNH